MKPLKLGDYVLASKFSDGDPQDNWAIGFYNGELRGRHHVIDKDGKSFRINGFNRVAKISAKRGNLMVKNIPYIEQGCRSVWWWKRTAMKNLLNVSGEKNVKTD